MRCTSMKLNKTFVNIIHSSPNLFWMCDECAKLMKCARFKTAMSSFGGAIEAITDKQDTAHAEIRSELAKQAQQIAQLSKRIASATPIRKDPEHIPRQPPLKRRRDEGPAIGKPLVGGTKDVSDNSALAEVLTVPEPAELFWLYLSRIHPTVKPESIEKLVKSCVQCEDPVKVVPLVKRGLDTSRMNFISYKVGFDCKLREVALCADTWPKGILFREFENTGSKNMWLPPKTPTITISPVPVPSEFSTPVSALDQMCES